MTTIPITVRIDAELKERLDALSKQTGLPGAFYIRQALEERLDELQYVYGVRAGGEAKYDLDSENI